MTQNEVILQLLMAQGENGVTPALAMREAGCMRLAARIAELKAAGNAIVNVGWTTPNGKHVARYVLRHPEPVQLRLGVAS